MRILHVLFTKGWGGLERFAMEQARAMAARGHDIIFLARRGTNTAEALRSEKGMKSMELAPLKYIDIRAMLSIRRLASREGVDIAHVHSSADLGLVAPALWRAPGVKLVFSNYMRVPAPKRDIYHRLEYARVDKVLTGSDYMRENSIENLPVPPEKVETLPYGLDMDRFDRERVPKGAVRSLYGIPRNAPLIGVISRLDPLKGQMEMIEAMPMISRRAPDAVLVLTGDETPELAGKYKPKLEAEARRLGAQDKVIFTGPTDDTASILADLDVYVLPSHAETFSLGCLEAMAMGKPVVGARAGGTPSMLEDGALGLLAEPKDPASLAENVVRLLEDETLRERISSAARDKVRKNYDRRAVFGRLEEVYRELSR